MQHNDLNQTQGATDNQDSEKQQIKLELIRFLSLPAFFNYHSESLFDFFIYDAEEPDDGFWKFLPETSLPPKVLTKLTELSGYCSTQLRDLAAIAAPKDAVIEIINYLEQIKRYITKSFKTQLSEENKKLRKEFIQDIEDMQAALRIGFQIPGSTKLSIENKPEPIEEKTIVEEKSEVSDSITQTFYFNSKASGVVINLNPNLSLTPKSLNVPLKNSDYLIRGDLHGNALKALYDLAQDGFIEFGKQEDYQVLKTIYKDSFNGALTKANKAAWLEIFSRIASKNPDQRPNNFFKGDTIFEKGSDDFLTFTIFKLLKELNIFVVTEWSNHDREFIRLDECYQFNSPTGLRFQEPNVWDLGDAHITGRSTLNLLRTIAAGVVTLAEVKDLYKNYYLPTLTAITLFVDKENKVFSFGKHATPPLSIINRLGKQFNLSMPGTNTIDDIEKSILAINLKFQELKKQKKLIANSSFGTALYDLCWYRKSNLKKGQIDPRLNDKIPDGWTIWYTHGHDGDEAPYKLANNKWVISLDNDLGRGNSYYASHNRNLYFGQNLTFKDQRNGFFNPQVVQNISNSNTTNQTLQISRK